MNRLALLVACSVVLSSSCAGPYAPENYCKTTLELQCRYWFQCCNAAERLRSGGGSTFVMMFGTEEDCKTEGKKWMCAGYQPYIEAVQQGRATWDEGRAEQCAEHFKQGAEQCDAAAFNRTGDGSCTFKGNIMQGTVKEGGLCYLTEECAGDESVCRSHSSTNPDDQTITLKGKCELPPGAGESCAQSSCATSCYCEYSSNVCRARKADGGACNDNFECTSDRCDTSAGPGVCRAKVALGGACLYPADCATSYCEGSPGYCVNPESTATQTYDLCDGNGFYLFGLPIVPADKAVQ